jgi:hypothetical protein|tara:strand:- start:739 stop:1287 length:549 start_codon:yes stop_codon:yes gene_type:complete
MQFRTTLTLSLTLLWTLGSCSCTHYSVIPTDAAPFKTIYVHTIANQGFAPNVHTLFQNQIRQTILRDNRLTLAKNPQECDTQLFITIEKYYRNTNTRSSVDAGRSNSLSLNLTILVSLYDNQTKSYLLKNTPIGSNESLFFDPVETSVNHREMEYQILPKITKDLSQNILELILSDWTVAVE